MSNPNDVQEQIDELNHLEEVMLDAKQFHTLEEKLEDLKKRGIDPSENAEKWDEEDQE
ncbi:MULTISPECIES: hypothetical protein [unclassified Acinetobacter]|uniref:hypothetical protein n=1 Tax=unclassified Acinetobacter TaxID=196816 RepID=UPI0035BA273E